jgi:hypothetical protein
MTHAVRTGIVSCTLALAGCAGAIPALHSGAAAIAAHASAAPVAAAAGAGGLGLGVGVLVSDDLKKLAREARDTQFGTQTAGTLGAFLQDGQTSAQKLVQAAMRIQRDAVIVAGLQAQAALGKAQAAFKDSRNVKIEALAEAESRFKAAMDSVMTDVASPADATVKAAGDRAREAAARIRLAPDVPQVRSLGPIYLFPFLPTQSITVRGAFPSAYSGDIVPELSVNGKTYKAYDYQADSLRFSIPTADFDAAEPRETAWVTAELLVPWNRPVLNIATSTEVAAFSMAIGVLTQSFGRMVVERDAASESVDLAWGSKHTFKIAAGAWKLRYVRIGSAPRELASADTSNPLINIQPDGSNLTVSVYPF